MLKGTLNLIQVGNHVKPSTYPCYAGSRDSPGSPSLQVKLEARRR